MDNFKAIYKILKYLDRYNGIEDMTMDGISAEALKLSEAKWEQILIELQKNGLISGLVYTQTLSDRYPHLTEPIKPQITLQGMQYLEENGLVRKAGRMIDGIVDAVSILK